MPGNTRGLSELLASEARLSMRLFPSIEELVAPSKREYDLGKRLRVRDAPIGDREDWLWVLHRIAAPVLQAAANRELAARMPQVPGHEDRHAFANLEAVGRLLAGLAPWFELSNEVLADDELALRAKLSEQAIEAIRSGSDEASSDHFLVEHENPQPLVDAAFLAIALLRAPTALWDKLDANTQGSLLDLLRQTRSLHPHVNNWLLFSAAIEALLLRVGEEDWDPLRIDLALRKHEDWYHGDGTYGDGREYHCDYYNSFVIQPFLVEIVNEASGRVRGARKLKAGIYSRASRYAEILERMIAPDGTYPPVGRSLVYRFGAFHALAHAALRDLLPEDLPPGQVRSALSAVLDRQMDAPGTLDENGWLRVGLFGHQPALGEHYISTGSLYLCANVLLPLGLAPDHDFWTQPEQAWTSVRIWSGDDTPFDTALRTRVSAKTYRR